MLLFLLLCFVLCCSRRAHQGYITWVLALLRKFVTCFYWIRTVRMSVIVGGQVVINSEFLGDSTNVSRLLLFWWDESHQSPPTPFPISTMITYSQSWISFNNLMLSFLLNIQILFHFRDIFLPFCLWIFFWFNFPFSTLWRPIILINYLFLIVSLCFAVVISRFFFHS